MQTPPQFVQAADGSRVAYQVWGGNDPSQPALVFANGYATSSFYWWDVIRHFGSRVRMVTWDLKGHGFSGPAASRDACSIPDSVDDMRRVMDAANIERATLVGFSVGCQVVLEAWRQIPDRIDAIVPVLGTYGRPFDNLLNPLFGRLALEVFRRGRMMWPLGLRATAMASRLPLTHRLNQITGMIGPTVTRARMQPFYEHLTRIHGPTWVAMGLAAQEHSAEDILHQIEVPVLVVAGGRDVMTPVALSHQMTERIPDADLLMLPNATHAGLFEEPHQISESLEAFLSARGLLEAGTRKAS